MEFFCIDIQHFVLKLHDLIVNCILIKLNGLRRVIDTMVTVIKSVKHSALVSLSKSSVVNRQIFLIKDQVCWIKKNYIKLCKVHTVLECYFLATKYFS